MVGSVNALPWMIKERCLYGVVLNSPVTTLITIVTGICIATDIPYTFIALLIILLLYVGDVHVIHYYI